MRAIIHCPWCSSRTDMLTDGNGGLVERLNHPCTCPKDRKVERVHVRVKSATKRKRACVDCGLVISGWAKRCPEHSKLHKRKVTAQREKDRRRQGWTRKRKAA